MNTTGTIASFRVGYQDASVLCREIFPPGFLEISRGELKLPRVGRYTFFPFPYEERQSLTHEELATLLTELDKREFWAKRRGPYMPSKQRTFDMPTPAISTPLSQAREQLMRISGERYGRLKVEVKKELEHERQQLINRLGTNPAAITDYEET